ncbi:MAG: exopolysaccharide transport family protein [Hyphomicrobiales bacterium]
MMQYSREMAPAQPASIALTDVLRGIWSRRKMIAALTIIATVLAIAYVSTQKPRYTTQALVLVDSLETPFDRTQPDATAPKPAMDERDVLSQVSVIESRDLGDRVVRTLKLQENPEFDALASSGLGIISRLRIALGFGEDPRNKTPEQRALARYDSMLSVYQIPLSKVIAIQYSANDPKIAAEVANTLAETYVTSTREAQSEPTNRAREWLAQQIDELRKKVAESESAAEEFRAKAGLLKGAETTLSAQELSELNSQIVLAESARSEAEAKARQIRAMLASDGVVDGSGEVLNSALIQRLREQQVVLNRNLAELSVRYLPNHPRIIAARSELASLDRQIRVEALKVVRGLEDQAKVAASREAELRASLNAAKARASETNLDDVKLRALEREAAANRSLLETFLNRYMDASARQDVIAQPGTARIIERAPLPTSPSFPKTGPTVLLAMLAGLGLGLGLAFVAEVMNAAARVALGPSLPAPPPPVLIEASPVRATVAEPPRRPEMPPAINEVEPSHGGLVAEVPKGSVPQTLGSASPTDILPALCSLPFSRDLTAAVAHGYEVIGKPTQSYAKATTKLGSWAASVRQTLGVKRIAVAALATGTAFDTTAASAALARSLVQQGTKTIILDIAGSGDTFAHVFGLQPRPGLTELLSGSADFNAVIARDMASDLNVISAGRDAAGLADLLRGSRFAQALNALETVYDQVLLDCGEVTLAMSPAIHAAQAILLLAPSSAAADAGRKLQELRGEGILAAQYVRLTERDEIQAHQAA